MLQGNQGGAEQARRLRKDMTLPEVLLRQHLRGSPNGLKLRKQHPSGPYTVDFYSHKARPIIEVDGISHNMGSNPAKDSWRDTWFAQRNLEILRITATEVLKNVAITSQSIIDHATAKVAREY